MFGCYQVPLFLVDATRGRETYLDISIVTEIDRHANRQTSRQTDMFRQKDRQTDMFRQTD